MNATPSILNRKVVSLEMLVAMRHNGGAVRLLEAVAGYYGFKGEELLAKSRTATLVWARHVGMWVAYRQLNNYSDVGRLFHRTHGDVMHAVDRVEFERSRSKVVMEGTTMAELLARAAVEIA